jgi:hypothetical protein
MFRSIPTPNKLLQEKWRGHNLDMHYRRIADMKPVLSNTRPAKPQHKTSKPNRAWISKDRLSEIQRDNMKLVSRISTIMDNPSPIRVVMTTPVRSLNRDARKQKLVQVTADNLSLLNRIKGQKSSYDLKKLKDSRKFHERMLRHMCEFPYSLGRSSSTRGLHSPVTNGLRASESVKSLSSPMGKPRRLDPLESGEIVFKVVKVLEERSFMVAVFKAKKDLTVLVQELGRDDSYSMHLSYKEAAVLMNRSDDYSQIVEALQMEEGELVLVEPRQAGGLMPRHEPTGSLLNSVSELPTEHEGRAVPKLGIDVHPEDKSRAEVKLDEVGRTGPELEEEKPNAAIEKQQHGTETGAHSDLHRRANEELADEPLVPTNEQPSVENSVEPDTQAKDSQAAPVQPQATASKNSPNSHLEPRPKTPTSPSK